MAGFNRWSRGLFPRPWWVNPANYFRRLFLGQKKAYSKTQKGKSVLFNRRKGLFKRNIRISQTSWSRTTQKPPALKWMFSYILLFILVVAGVFTVIDKRLRPTLHQLAMAKARILATEAVTSAVALEIAEDIRWEDLYALRPDSAGKVVLVQPNTGEIDRLTSKVTLRVQEYLNEIGDSKVIIPLGQLLGSHILASIGPRITISIIPIGTVSIKIHSDFEQAGINQIRHKIYLEVIAHMQVVVPMVVATDDIAIQIPITEVLIMGDVPETYIQVNGKDIKNLLPQ